MQSTTAPTKNNTLLPLHSNRRATQESIAHPQWIIAPLTRFLSKLRFFAIPILQKSKQHLYWGANLNVNCVFCSPMVYLYAAINVVLIILKNRYKEHRSPAPQSKGAGLRFCAVKIILIGSSRYFFLCPLFSVRRLPPACAKRPRWNCR